MTASDELALVWFRRDLRLDDNPAWAAATSERRYVAALYVLDRRLLRQVGPYRRRQLIANLQALDYDLFERTGGRLVVRTGDPVRLVPDTARRLGCGVAYWNADVSRFAGRRDAAVTEALGVPVHSWYGSLVLPPGSVLTKKGTLPRVFSAFHKTWQATSWDPWPAPGDAVVFDKPAEVIPRLDGQAPFPEGEQEAKVRLEAFLARVDDYAELRDLPAEAATSTLSSDLHFGTLSARTVATAVGAATPGREAFVRQLAWRDWYAHLLAETPNLAELELDPRTRPMAWRNEPAEISAWKGGFTGYPIVDAAMRELRETGWMHNRLRMVAASFLVKDLLVDWRIGERHFRNLLVDADLAQNAGNWQWVAGTGPDASPYTRVFNPVTQSRKFDPTGAYLRRWAPELAALDDDMVHAPWEASAETLAAAGVRLGSDYPQPVVDHAEARVRYLAALELAKAATTGGEASADGEPVD